ncbi:MAG: hypothetical protein AB1330_01745 [Bacillota bacterium]
MPAARIPSIEDAFQGRFTVDDVMLLLEQLAESDKNSSPRSKLMFTLMAVLLAKKKKPRAVWEALVTHPKEEVRSLTAYAPDLPEDLQVLLALDRSPIVRRSLTASWGSVSVNKMNESFELLCGAFGSLSKNRKGER